MRFQLEGLALFFFPHRYRCFGSLFGLFNLPASHFNEAVEGLISDWQGQDEIFYHSRAMQTIAWYCGKAKSFIQASAEIRAGERGRFMEAVCREYGMQPRRLQEGLQVYKKYAAPSDSVMETAERIFQDAGGWSKALPPKPEKEAEPECKRCFHCPSH